MHLSETRHNKKNDCRLSRTQVDSFVNLAIKFLDILRVYDLRVNKPIWIIFIKSRAIIRNTSKYINLHASQCSKKYSPKVFATYCYSASFN